MIRQIYQLGYLGRAIESCTRKSRGFYCSVQVRLSVDLQCPFTTNVTKYALETTCYVSRTRSSCMPSCWVHLRCGLCYSILFFFVYGNWSCLWIILSGGGFQMVVALPTCICKASDARYSTPQIQPASSHLRNRLYGAKKMRGGASRVPNRFVPSTYHDWAHWL